MKIKTLIMDETDSFLAAILQEPMEKSIMVGTTKGAGCVDAIGQVNINKVGR